MKLSLILTFLWIVACSITAMMPMRHQFIPGLTLLILTPFMLGFLGYQYGLWVMLLGLAAFVSMFRRPLQHLLRKALGKPTSVAKEFEGNSR